MGFFSSSSDNSNDKSAISSVLDKDMHVTGDVTCQGKVRIDGRVDGNVTVEYLILSETGLVNGDVEAGVVICHGRIDGNVKAAKFNAKATASINGKVEVDDLSVDFGASLNGEIKARTQDLRLIKGAPAAGASNVKDASQAR